MKKLVRKKYFTDKSLDDILNLNYTGVEYNSQKIENGNIFIALNGTKDKGSKYILSAIEKGAKLILTDDYLDDSQIKQYSKYDVVIFEIEKLRENLGEIFLSYYNIKLEKLKYYAITGTNGKTTCSYLLEYFLGNNTRIGTNNYNIAGEIYESKNTTPESIDLVKYIKKSIDKNILNFIMEVSSHSLMMNRVNFMKFDYVIFTNLSQDHLDYHKTIDEYFKAKKKIFNQINKNGIIVINSDNYYTKTLKDEFLNDSIEKEYKILTFSTIDKNSDYYGEILSYTNNGMEIFIRSNLTNKEKVVNTKLIGKHNLENLLSCIAIIENSGILFEDIILKIKDVPSVKGRAEIIENDKGIMVVVDYAHTDDGLDNICLTLSKLKKNKLISVFGAGGDRDNKKRKLMGMACSKYSDYIILTSDNPRSEDPIKILKEIEEGITIKDYEIIEKRDEAIKKAIDIANKDDIILIAGKGHEDYQIIGDKKIYFSDQEEAIKCLKEKI